jgi:diguanylate cyclase (GGDEF)-like protein
MTTKDPLLQLTATGERVAHQWAEACSGDIGAGELDHDAAGRFLEAITEVLSRRYNDPDAIDLDVDASMASAARALTWAAGSATIAVQQLIVLRDVVHEIVEHANAPVRPSLVRAFDRLIDQTMVSVVRDTVTELERDALVDPLTGLFNRRALARNLELEIGRASRQQREFSLIYIDIDGLKAVNDRDGHAAGDERLRALAAALLGVLRKADTAYRVGGDEFVILLPETPKDAISAIVDRVAIDGAPETTWGAASYPNQGGTADALLDAADRAMLARRRQRKTATGLGFEP